MKMNKKIFSENLINTLQEYSIDAGQMNYRVVPVFERGKKYSSKDDFMRLNVFPPDKISDRVFSFEDIIQRYSIFEPLYPMWIDVYKKDDKNIILYSSMRYRKPSEIMNREGGYKPFIFLEDDSKYRNSGKIL